MAAAGEPADDAYAGVCAACDYSVVFVEVRLDFAVCMACSNADCSERLRDGAGCWPEICDVLDASEVIGPDREAASSGTAAGIGVACSFDHNANVLLGCPLER